MAEKAKNGKFKRGGAVPTRARGGALPGNSMTDGKITPDPDVTQVYAGQGSNVIKEAKDKRKRGGRISEVKIEGERSKDRFDRKRRATGGRVGADQAPLSSAANSKGYPKDPW